MNNHQNLSGTLESICVHRPNAWQKLANLFLPSDRKILGRIVHEEKNLKNLILNGGMGNSGPPVSFFGNRTCNFRTYESALPNKKTMDATGFAVEPGQIYLSNGGGVFNLNELYKVGTEVLFPSGERFHIISRPSPTSNNALISKTNLTIESVFGVSFYNTAYDGTGDTVKQFKTSAVPSAPDVNYIGGFASKSWAVVMDAASTPYSLNSVTVEFNNGSLGARVVLPSTIPVASGDMVSMRYTLQIQAVARETKNISLSQLVTGYPVAYSCTNISSSLNRIQISMATNHHFLAGDEITVAGGGIYNGTYVVETVIAPTVIRVIAMGAVNGSGGSGATISSPNIATETVYGRVFDERQVGPNNWLGLVANESEKRPIPPVSQTELVNFADVSFLAGGNSAITFPSHENDWTTVYAPDPTDEWFSGGATENRVKQINIGNGEVGQQRLIEFRTAQPKLNTHKMTLPAYRVQMLRDLN